MSIFTLLAIILGVLAGVINLGIGILNRDVVAVMLLRVAAAIVSFAAPVVILVMHSQGLRIVPTGWHSTVYLTLALAIFVGITLMMPATLQRSLMPAQASTTPPPRVTSKLSGEPGVRTANQNDEWVN